jgi:hypothetical protein
MLMKTPARDNAAGVFLFGSVYISPEDEQSR